MGLGTMTHSVQRAWTVEIRPQHGGTTARCLQCGRPVTATPPATTLRRTVLAHLAGHARANALPLHLRTCQCRENGCRWHPRHRGCDGPILLVLTRGAAGRLWRLADACRACAQVMENGAVVREAVGAKADPRPPSSSSESVPYGRQPILRASTGEQRPADAEVLGDWWDETWEVWGTDDSP